ncbi:MAG: class I SAM-dependent methyltransferase [Kiloniellaceae bacterium]
MAVTDHTDPEAFKAFELCGWDKVSGPYHDHFGPVTRQSVAPLLDAAAVGPGVRLLDVATGPGYAAAAAAERGAEVIAVDFSATQIKLAGTLYPSVTFQQGDAEALDFADASFDALVANFGMLHFPRPERAMAEAHRVLRPTGRFAFTVWSMPDKAVGLGIVLKAVTEHGNMEVPLPPGPSFFRFSEADECRRSLTEAGFIEVEVAEIPMVWMVPSAQAAFDAVRQATVRTGALLDAQAPEALNSIRRAVAEGLGAYRREDHFAVPMSAVLASAVKP